MNIDEEKTKETQDIQNNIDTSEQKNFNISNIPVIPQLAVALGLLVIIFGITYIGVGSSISKTVTDDVRVEKTPPPKQNVGLSVEEVFDDIRLEAKSAIIWDVRNERVLFNKDADIVLPLASVTKLMTALVASELLDPTDIVAVSRRAIQTEGDSGLAYGEHFTAQDLTDLVLISSSNDGAVALSAAAGNVVSNDRDPEDIFVTAMNLKAKELGLSRTHYYNNTGLDISETEAGAYGSARDMAQLMDYIIINANDAIELTKVDAARINNKDGQYHIAKNTNTVVNDIDGLIASKTGYTELAGGNLVVAFNAGLNRPIVAVVLASSFNGRFHDMLDLINRTRTYISQEENN